MAAHRGESRRENPQKSFDTRDCMKIEPPDNVFGVVKTGQTRGSSQGGVKKGKNLKRNLHTRLHENRSTR